jgi:hypothetical protein
LPTGTTSLLLLETNDATSSIPLAQKTEDLSSASSIRLQAGIAGQNIPNSTMFHVKRRFSLAHGSTQWSAANSWSDQIIDTPSALWPQPTRIDAPRVTTRYKYGSRGTNRGSHLPITELCSECILVGDSQEPEDAIEILLVCELHAQLALSLTNGDVHLSIEAITQTLCNGQELWRHLRCCT